MKIQLTINDELTSTEVHIHTPQYTEKIEKMMHVLQTIQTPTTIDGYVEQTIHFVPVQDIYAVYAEGAKVYIQTNEDEFEVKRKLYEVEDLFAHDFVRVNKSTLIHLQKLVSIQMGKLGTTEAVLSNGVSIHISRKYMKELKQKLGIGRDGV
ncbi:LytTR family DNA-binding domain-containing protein [Caryophanon tenue]|uniref:Response regulator n=1 Tax=Caryophanon tenue TaxID=33978 RepID=A0A1C0YHS2_9BACL|nr:LytTR family DNA-binding domain-containing protein [Caryophanon tenue]OCS86669.1 response regulator [Caryophanon tenue]